VVGRSRSVEGPYLDNVGRDMLKGGGRMVIAAGHRVCGPGHFGRTVIDEGVEVMSCHYEADFERSGRSVLGIRPLLWRNGWPVAGEPFVGGIISGQGSVCGVAVEIESERRGYSLELAVDLVRIPQERERFWQMDLTKPVKSIPNQSLADVVGTWPQGHIPVRCSDYMFRPHQLWTIKPVAEGGGYLGGPYYQIVIAGTNRTLAATADKELVTLPAFTGTDEQLWRIEQLVDGTYRIMPKRLPGEAHLNTRYVLFSVADSTPTLAEYDAKSDNSKWNFVQ
jgi:arabinan endo-1,5-alpha-L-arabinosidase